MSDIHLIDAINIIYSMERASIPLIQRRLRIGYTRAARIMDVLEEAGIVSPPYSDKPRDILIDDIRTAKQALGQADGCKETTGDKGDSE